MYKLVPLINLDRTTQLQVLKIRNQKYIREWMFTEKEINTDEHFNWIEQLKGDQSQICLIIIDDKAQPLGAVNIKKIDMNNKNAELGFYKTQDIDEKGLMTKCVCTVIDYSFDVLGLDKIYSEVFEDNVKSMNLFKKLLFNEEGFLRSHVIKGGLRIGVHLFGLLKSEWRAEKYKLNLVNEIAIEKYHV